MATLPQQAADKLQRDICALPMEIAGGVTTKQSKATLASWKIWCNFCFYNKTDPGLSNHEDPVGILQVFARRYRDGRLAPSRMQVQSRTVEDVLRAVGQAFAKLGAPDPRKSYTGQIDFRLQCQLAYYKRMDVPTARRQPIPIKVLHNARLLADSGGPKEHAMSNLVYLGFYYLLRPGEYARTSGLSQ